MQLGGTGPPKPGELDRSELEWGGQGRRARQKRTAKRNDIEQKEADYKERKEGRTRIDPRDKPRKRVRKEDLRPSKTREGKRAMGKLGGQPKWPRR